jgi:hypothetical protein
MVSPAFKDSRPAKKSSGITMVALAQPQQIAATTQSSQVTEGWPVPFLKMRTHSSVSLAWLACSHFSL